MPPVIRPARAEDLPLLREVELAAGSLFAGIGMDEIAADEPGAIGEDELVFVADDHGAIVGYVHLRPVDGALHVEQVSVVPSVAGRRIGAALLDRADQVARDLGCDRLTLTTFRDVPWNGPYYERLGFVVETEPGPELAALVEHERDMIPGDAPRVCMARALRDRRG